MNDNEIDDHLEPPSDLGERGAALWAEVHSRFDVHPWEEVVLVEAARCLDTLERLAAIDAPDTQTNRHGERVAAAHVVEARQQQANLIRLIASLRLPEVDEHGEIVAGGRPQRRGAARGAYGIRGVV